MVALLDLILANSVPIWLCHSFIALTYAPFLILHVIIPLSAGCKRLLDPYFASRPPPDRVLPNSSSVGLIFSGTTLTPTYSLIPEHDLPLPVIVPVLSRKSPQAFRPLR